MGNELGDHERQEPTRRGRVSGGRRRFLVGAAPFVMTVASRPAFASIHVCTHSGFGSLDPSHVVNSLPDGNCGLTPGCWASAGLNTSDGFWSSDYFDISAVAPTTHFVDLFFPNPSTGVLGPIDGQVQLGFIVNTSTTLLQALNGATFIQYKQKKNDPAITLGAEFSQKVTAALLNALAFNGATPIHGHYPGTETTVKDTIKNGFFNYISGKSKQDLGTSAYSPGTIVNLAGTKMNEVYIVGSAPCDA